jgi:hypothetical protein
MAKIFLAVRVSAQVFTTPITAPNNGSSQSAASLGKLSSNFLIFACHRKECFESPDFCKRMTKQF